MKNEKKIIASKNDHGRILLKFLIKILENVPVSRIYKLLRKKDIKINGKRISDPQTIIQFKDKIIIYGLIDLHKKLQKTKVK